jgi:hypothetical protein
MLSRIRSLFRKSDTPDYKAGERREPVMVREVINKTEDEDRIKREVARRVAELVVKKELSTKAPAPIYEEPVEEEQEESAHEEEQEEEKKPQVYLQPTCVSTEQMFNILNDKFDTIVNWMSQVITKQNEIISKLSKK